MDNFERFAGVIEECLDRAIADKSFKDPQNATSPVPMGCEVIAFLLGVVYQYVVSFTFLIKLESSLS
jgi:hypothetical protein